MAKTVLTEQQVQVQTLKDFIAGGVKTKLGYEIDDKNLVFMSTLVGKTLLKSTVKNVVVPKAPQNPLQQAITFDTEPKTQDVVMFWDMNGNALGNDAFTLVKIL